MVDDQRMIGPGEPVGVLGGGQLGRMLALAAAKLGLDVHIYDPDPDAPAGRVAARSTSAPFDDVDALKTFARACRVVTCEFENVPAEALAAVASTGVRVAPGPGSFAVAQDRLEEKRFFNALGAETAWFQPVRTLEEAREAGRRLNGPGLLKTAREGYDGKGQKRTASEAEVVAAFESFDGAPCLLEGVVAFHAEFSVILARWADGRTVSYEPALNRHEGGVLVSSEAPADLAADIARRGVDIAKAAADALDHVGVMAVEFFATADGRAVVNEMAPRVHNSGHWTPEACSCGQFEQHLRACCDWPPGDVSVHGRARMVNILGEDVDSWPALAAQPTLSLTVYGKRNASLRRKMGHYVVIEPL